MQRRKFLKTITTGTAGLIGASALQPWSALSQNRGSKEPPNIIVILADDMGFSDVGCYGAEIQTPNIDRLANEGVRFSQFYTNPRCAPSRASLLTGLYPHQTGIGLMLGDDGIPGYRGDLGRNAVTIAEVLKSAGYRTGAVGKWHVTPFDFEKPDKSNWPLQRGFDDWYGFMIGANDYFNPVAMARNNELIETTDPDYYLTDAITDEAVSYIDKYAGTGQPFFLYGAYSAPHWPLHARQEDIRKYEDLYRDGWDTVREKRYQRMIDAGILNENWPLTPRDPRVDPWEDEQHKEWETRRMAVYAAQIDRLDQGIGRILSTLEKNNIRENTLVMFLSDNGGCAERLSDAWARLPAIPEKTRDGRPVAVGNKPDVMPGPPDTYQSYGIGWANASNTPFRLYKHWAHEGGIATPFVISWPQIIENPGNLHQQSGHIIDLMATCLHAADIGYPENYSGNSIIPLEGQSLLPALKGKPYNEHEVLGWEHHGNKALRKGAWKIVHRRSTKWKWEKGDPGTWELYNLEDDRTEMNNLAQANPEKLAELKDAYNDWADRTNVVDYDTLREMRKNN